MNASDITAVLPLIVIAATALAVMLSVAFYRHHGLTAVLTLAGLAVALASLLFIAPTAPRKVTALLIIAIFWLGLFPRPVLTTTGPALGNLQFRVSSSQESMRPPQTGLETQRQLPVRQGVAP